MKEGILLQKRQLICVCLVYTSTVILREGFTLNISGARIELKEKRREPVDLVDNANILSAEI